MNKYPEELIQKIVESIDIIKYISQYTILEEDNKNYFGICPIHKNDTDPSLCVPKTGEYYMCFGCKSKGNIIKFVMELHKISFPEAMELLLREIGEDVEYVENKSKTFKFFKNIKNLIAGKSQIIEREYLLDDVMLKYKKIPIQEWIDEGISQEVMDKYNVRYDEIGNRIVFPVWDNEGNIISIKGRTTIPNFKELKLRKYTYYYPIKTNNFLWGYYQKKDTIQKEKTVIIFEGSKSVMKVESWGINNAVSLETSHINYEQLKDLISLKVDIVIALDKGISIKEIQKDVEPLKKFTNVYAIIDTENVLEDKSSPCDYGYYVFQDLYDNKIRL